MINSEDAIPENLPRLPHRGGQVRADVTIEQLSGYGDTDLQASVTWAMAVGEYAANRSTPPTLPPSFEDATVDDIRQVMIGHCSKEEILVLLAWLAYQDDRLDRDLFSDDESGQDQPMRNAEPVVRAIESVDDDLLSETPEDYSTVGSLPAQIVSSIEAATAASAFDLGYNLNLNAVAIGLGLDNTEYSPQEFPGEFYRPERGSLGEDVTMVIFGTGQVVCFAQSDRGVRESETSLREQLDDLGFLG
ncbi:TATA-box-binding protein [Salinigranum halophilum]|uniref:hypothetical protein n=1 Tax=Salinigranum halophilum TaxID=2565931 RepID=UPI00115D8F22|nr:hypothetical protein [Salinigranum halophilum]